MLVMSRRKDQKIVFPALGITVTVINIRGNTARIGVDAPREISILRDEVATTTCNPSAAERSDSHAVRNVLNSVSLYAMVYQKQTAAGLSDEAATTFLKMVDYLERQTHEGVVDFRLSDEYPAPIQGHVMIIEDDEEQRHLLSSLLRLHGLRVSTFDNGQRALASLQTEPRPDVILLDWAMPQFGGEWLVPKIRSEFGSAAPKMFVISGAESVRKNSPPRVDAWLAKPVNQEALLARIRAVYSSV